MEDADAVEPLVQALREDEDAQVRKAAAEALGYLGGPGAVAALEAVAAQEPDRDVGAAAKRALARINRQ